MARKRAHGAALLHSERLLMTPKADDIAQSRSTAIQTAEDVRFRFPIVGHPPHQVFWSRTDDGPRIEAVFPHPLSRSTQEPGWTSGGTDARPIVPA